MATKVLKSVKGRALRITRLDECGAPVAGPCSSIVSWSFVSATLSAEVESGEEQTTKNAWGEYCVNEKDPDITKWVNASVVLCEIHPDILDVIGGASPVLVGGDTVGVTFGPNSPTQAFAIEIWTKKSGAGACGAGGTLEWGYFVIPWIRNGRIDGDITIENRPLNLTIRGEGIGAAADWGVGPYTPPPFSTHQFPVGDLWGVGVTTVQPPAATNGCAPLIVGGANPGAVEAGDEFAADPAITAEDAPNAALLVSEGYVVMSPTVLTVTNKALTSNVATLTVGAHTLPVGEKITVALSPGDAVFDGVQTITAVTGTTLSYAKTNANVASTGAGGTVSSGPWESGEFMSVGDYRFYWNGTAWVAGVAP